MRRAAIVLAVAAAGLIPAAFMTGGASAAPARAAAATLTLTPSGVNGPVGAVVSDSKWRVRGVVSHYVPGQRVELHVFRNGTRVIDRRVSVRRDGSTGVFTASLKVGGVGRLTVRAIHTATARQNAMVSRAFGLWLVAPEVAPDQHSYAVRILQYELAKAHFIVGAPGVYDAQTQWAVMAFRKLAGLERNFVADTSVFQALAAHEGTFTIRYPDQGRHIEADLTHQVIALIGANGVIERIYAISSGKPSTPTALGNFRFYLQEPGTNNDGMVNSSFFNGGDAIHGYAEVPSYAASHGCLRVWIPDSLSIMQWVTIGTPIEVYYR
ncbi:MAG TPA: L,D-transpeptidase family protein [Solirubrobacteraceae bacterium]|jgi:lipoprotein-anchoring transpeptidase ErfK/SrfK